MRLPFAPDPNRFLAILRLAHVEPDSTQQPNEQQTVAREVVCYQNAVLRLSLGQPGALFRDDAPDTPRQKWMTILA